MKTSTGSILSSPCDLFVCPTNCVPGVMGGGLAKAFAERWPELINHHWFFYSEGYADVGRTIVFGLSNLNDDSQFTKYVAFLATKRHWSFPSKLEWVESGLRSLGEQIVKANTPPFICNIRSVAIPALGCGLGGLDWKIVGPMIERWSKTVDVEVVVYPPVGRLGG